MAAGVCLLVYVQCTGMLPAVLALGATLEGSHDVFLRPGADCISVVLHHESGPGTRPASHRHGLASKLVCLLEGSAAALPNDHCASFACPATCEETPTAVVPAAPDCSAACPPKAPIAEAPAVSPPYLTASIAVIASAHARQFRATILLV